MVDPTTDFFEALKRREYDARVRMVSGTLSFDIDGSEGQGPWFVAIDRGGINVSREPREPDCVVRAGRALFNGIVAGEDNAIAALLRGAVTADGDLQLLIQFQRLMPPPPGARDPRQRRPNGEEGR